MAKARLGKEQLDRFGWPWDFTPRRVKHMAPGTSIAQCAVLLSNLDRLPKMMTAEKLDEVQLGNGARYWMQR